MSGALVAAIAGTLIACMLWRRRPLRPRLQSSPSPPRWMQRVVRDRQDERERRAHADAIARDLPDTVDLLSVAVTAGYNVSLAVQSVCRARDGPSVEALRAAIRDVAGGARLADALARLPTTHGEPLRALTAVLADADRYGTPLGPALEQLAGDLRGLARRRADARARRLPVQLLLPLVTCVLPALALLTVVPLLVSGLRALTDQSPTNEPTLRSEPP